MDERELRGLLGQVKAGRLSRRSFMETMLGLGLTAPMVHQMFASVGMAQAQPKSAYAPTKRGGGGALKVLWWQSPTLLNPHFAVGTKDQDGSRIFYEPLAAFEPDGNLVPDPGRRDPQRAERRAQQGRPLGHLAPQEERGLARRQAIHRRRRGLQLGVRGRSRHRGHHHRVVQGHRADRQADSHTVKITFKKPLPFWADAFCSNRGMIIPKHLFEAYRGGKSREAPTNLKPVGTGPYKFVDFKPGDIVRAELNPELPHGEPSLLRHPGDEGRRRRGLRGAGRDPDRRSSTSPGTCRSRTRSCERMEQGGRGRVDIAVAGNIEHIQCNQTDPWKEVDGERSSLKTTHPFLTDPAVRQALNLLVDRASIQEQIYGRLGQTSANFLNAPSRFHSKSMKWEFNVDKANQILEAAGWKRGADGIRAKDGKKLKMVYQTSINAPRQKTQAIVKQAAAKAGIDLELKSVLASVYFSSDVANPDTYAHFYTDIQMYTTTMGAPDPADLHGAVHLVGGGEQGQQVAGPQHHPLAQRGVRQALAGGRDGARPRQARGPLRPDERPRHPERGGHPRPVAQRDLRRVRQAQGHGHLGLGLEPLEPRQLVPRGVEVAAGGRARARPP